MGSNSIRGQHYGKIVLAHGSRVLFFTVVQFCHLGIVFGSCEEFFFSIFLFWREGGGGWQGEVGAVRPRQNLQKHGSDSSKRFLHPPSLKGLGPCCRVFRAISLCGTTKSGIGTRWDWGFIHQYFYWVSSIQPVRNGSTVHPQHLPYSGFTNSCTRLKPLFVAIYTGIIKHQGC